MDKRKIKKRITQIFQDLFPTATKKEVDLVPKSLTDGKIYEAYIVSVVAEKLTTVEQCSLTLVNSYCLSLKSSPGPINRKYPHIRISRNNSTIAELWTDIEYLSMSYCADQSQSPTRGDYHELDIVIADPGLQGRPSNHNIWLGVECKNLDYNKSLLKEILGVRRELSLLVGSKPTKFVSWPRSSVPASPPSCLAVFASKPSVLEFSRPGEFFGIDFFHEEMPE